MKKTIITLALATVTALGAAAQTSYTIQRACHPDDAKKYDSYKLREHLMMPVVLEQDKINLS